MARPSIAAVLGSPPPPLETALQRRVDSGATQHKDTGPVRTYDSDQHTRKRAHPYTVDGQDVGTSHLSVTSTSEQTIHPAGGAPPQPPARAAVSVTRCPDTSFEQRILVQSSYAQQPGEDTPHRPYYHYIADNEGRMIARPQGSHSVSRSPPPIRELNAVRSAPDLVDATYGFDIDRTREYVAGFLDGMNSNIEQAIRAARSDGAIPRRKDSMADLRRSFPTQSARANDATMNDWRGSAAAHSSLPIQETAACQRPRLSVYRDPSDPAGVSRSTSSQQETARKHALRAPEVDIPTASSSPLSSKDPNLAQLSAAVASPTQEPSRLIKDIHGPAKRAKKTVSANREQARTRTLADDVRSSTLAALQASTVPTQHRTRLRPV
jgi:hypothetical protein